MLSKQIIIMATQAAVYRHKEKLGIEIRSVNFHQLCDAISKYIESHINEIASFEENKVLLKINNKASVLKYTNIIGKSSTHYDIEEICESLTESTINFIKEFESATDEVIKKYKY